MAADLKYTVVADLNDAIKQSNKLETSTLSLSKAVTQMQGPFAKVNPVLNVTSATLAKTAIEANKLDSALGKNLVNGSNQANSALLNLGRVVQDAPFGFIGIANNINPLLESFQRLKTETGTAGGALKALAGSLVGGGGLGLAVSIGTAALSLLGQSAYGAGKKSATAAEEIVKANKEAAESYKSVIDAVSKEAVQVSVIVEQLKNETLNRKQRNAAIEELQRLAPEYFATLDAEKATITQITKAYDLYSNSILRSVQARVVEKQLEDVVSKIVALQRKRIDFTKKEVDENGKLITSVNALYDDQIKGETEYQRFRSGRGALTKEENTELNNLLLTQTGLLSQLAKIKPIDFRIGKDKKVKDIETIADVLKTLNEQLSVLNTKELLFGTDETKGKITDIENAIEKLVVKFDVPTNDKLIVKLFGDVADLKLPEITKKLREAVLNTDLKPDDFFPAGVDFSGLFDPAKNPKDNLPPAIIPVEFIIAEKAKIKLENDIKSAVKNIASSVAASYQELIFGVFDGIGEGIGKALTGGKLTDIFGSLLSMVGDFVIKLGKAAIQTALIAQFLKSPFKNPVTGIAAGIAAIALGTIIKQATSKGFAVGGYVDGPGTSTSDSIPARLSRGEFVMRESAVSKFGVGFMNAINNGLIPAFAGGGMVSPSNNGMSIGGGQNLYISGDLKASGYDLRLVLQRANTSYNQNT